MESVERSVLAGLSFWTFGIDDDNGELFDDAMRCIAGKVVSLVGQRVVEAAKGDITRGNAGIWDISRGNAGIWEITMGNAGIGDITRGNAGIGDMNTGNCLKQNGGVDSAVQVDNSSSSSISVGEVSGSGGSLGGVEKNASKNTESTSKDSSFAPEQAPQTSPLLSIYAVHDTTLFPLLVLFNLFDYRWPPSGSAIAFELFHFPETEDATAKERNLPCRENIPTSSTEGHYFVRIVYLVPKEELYATHKQTYSNEDAEAATSPSNRDFDIKDKSEDGETASESRFDRQLNYKNYEYCDLASRLVSFEEFSLLLNKFASST